jgi:predicted neuraminidase
MTPDANIHDESLRLVPVLLNPGSAYDTEIRKWQGIPSIEATTGGTLYAAWYTGGPTECGENYVVVIRSRDGGATWSQPYLVIDPPATHVRAFDASIWQDPRGRLWIFWAQTYSREESLHNGRSGVWFIRTDTPDADEPVWTTPRRIANGVMMNKPFVRSNGEWLLPIAVWGAKDPRLPELKHEALSSIYVTTDEGLTFARRGGAEVPHRCYDEHMLIERRDGSLWMLVRTSYGIGQSVSTDGGVTWSAGWPTDIAGPCSRFHLRRLASGRVLLINHLGFTGRSHLTASLSDDDGKSWHGHLLLDERAEVSYPDVAITPDGRLYIIYDRERYKAREILLACVTEAEIATGKLKHPDSFLKRIVNKITT